MRMVGLVVFARAFVWGSWLWVGRRRREVAFSVEVIAWACR